MAETLPLAMKERCPICGEVVILYSVVEWETKTGVILQAEFGCDTEPDIDSDEWEDWHRGHHRMPYVDWMPWEQRAYAWLKKRFRWDFDGKRLVAPSLLKTESE